jgi:hypothetical protein
MIKVYASEQKVDHQEYKSIYEANAEEFAMIERNSQCVAVLRPFSVFSWTPAHDCDRLVSQMGTQPGRMGPSREHGRRPERCPR